MTSRLPLRTRCLLDIAKLEIDLYGEVVSPDAQEAWDAENERVAALEAARLARAADSRKAAGKPPAPVKRPVKPAPVKAPAMSPGIQVAAVAGTLVVFLVIATVISAGVDGIFLFVQHTVTYPSRCAPSAYGPPASICSASSQMQSVVWTDGLIYGIAVVLWLVALPAVIRQGMTRRGGTEGSAP